MKIKISYVLTLLTGIGIGAVAMYKYLNSDNEEPAKIFDFKKDEEEQAEKDKKFQDDIERVKSEVLDRFEQSRPKKKEGGKRLMKGDIAEVYDTGEFTDYDISDDDCADIPVIKGGDLEPHVIDMDDFGLYADYKTMSVIIYADGYVADDMEHLVKNPEVLLGKGVIDFFKTHDTDCVYIRNDDLATDIEVIRDLTDWADFVETLPPDYCRMKWED